MRTGRSSDLSTVIRPVQHRLPLPPSAVHVARLAMLPDRGHVARDRPPAPDLPRIVRRTPAHVVAAVPLEPAAGILGPEPSLPSPLGERLGRVDAEAVEPAIVPRRIQLRVREPAG